MMVQELQENIKINSGVKYFLAQKFAYCHTQNNMNNLNAKAKIIGPKELS